MLRGQVKWLSLVSVSMELIMNFAVLSPAANQTAGYDQHTRGQADEASRWWWLCVFLAQAELHSDMYTSSKRTDHSNLNYTDEDKDNSAQFPVHKTTWTYWCDRKTHMYLGLWSLTGASCARSKGSEWFVRWKNQEWINTFDSVQEKIILIQEIMKARRILWSSLAPEKSLFIHHHRCLEQNAWWLNEPANMKSRQKKCFCVVCSNTRDETCESSNRVYIFTTWQLCDCSVVKYGTRNPRKTHKNKSAGAVRCPNNYCPNLIRFLKWLSAACRTSQLIVCSKQVNWIIFASQWVILGNSLVGGQQSVFVKRMMCLMHVGVPSY